MRIDELKRIVAKNGYKLVDDALAVYIYGYSHGNSDEFKTEIWISKSRAKDIVIRTGIYCEEEEFNVMKAAIEFAETPPDERGGRMTKNKRGRILKLTERIIKKVNSLGYKTPGDACEIINMLDKLEDYLMAYKAYKTKFKEDIRYLRYLIWSMAAVGADRQVYYQKDALKHLDILKDELYERILTKKEFKE